MECSINNVAIWLKVIDTLYVFGLFKISIAEFWQNFELTLYVH